MAAVAAAIGDGPGFRVRACLGLERHEAMAVMQIYHEAFPAAQRVADAALLRLALRGNHEPGGWHFHLAERRPEPAEPEPKHERRATGEQREAGDQTHGTGTETIGFVAGLHVSPLRLAYVAYLAVRADWRGRGAGTALFQSLVETWSHARPRPPRWIFLEVERPELASSDEDRARRGRRLRFYERLGCRSIQADFQAPPLGPGLPIVPYRILVFPFPDADFAVSSLRTALADVYREVYGLDEGHPLVTHCLASLRA